MALYIQPDFAPSCPHCRDKSIIAYHDAADCPVLGDPERFQQATLADVRRIVREELVSGSYEHWLKAHGFIAVPTVDEAVKILGVDIQIVDDLTTGDTA